MATDEHWAEAHHYLDLAKKGMGEATHKDMVALVGIGYAIMALADEVEALKLRLPATSE